MHVHNHMDLFPASTIEQHTEKKSTFSVGCRSTENFFQETNLSVEEQLFTI
jgi:hypothetical protein